MKSTRKRGPICAKILDEAVKVNTIPDVLQAVSRGRADAGIVYLPAAVTVADDVYIISFPATVNLSEDICNVVTIPGTAENGDAGVDFVKLLLSAEGRRILQRTGQPPIVPPIKEGTVPFDISVEY